MFTFVGDKFDINFREQMAAINKYISSEKFSENVGNRFIYQSTWEIKTNPVKCNCPIITRAMACAVNYLSTCYTVLKSWPLIANQIREICYSFDEVK